MGKNRNFLIDQDDDYVEITEEGNLSVELTNSDGTIDVQNPLPTDGDSVYEKDIWLDESTSANFTGGDVTDLFNNLHTVITNTTSDNPKTVFIHFKRTIISNVVGLGCYGGGNFSNVKIEIATSGDVFTTVLDDSSNNTKYTSNTYQLPITAGFNGIRLTFHTTDTICLSNVVIPKTVGVVSRLQAAKPDDTVTDINATNGGNLKISLEELENDISTNSNTQLKVTQYDEDGNPAEVDNATHTLQIIEYEHHEIHAGSHYNYCDYALNQAVSTEIEFVLTTPNTTKWLHLVFEVYASDGATIELYEGTSGITGGTPIIPRNNERNSTNTSDATILKDPSAITSDGTRAAGFISGGVRTSGATERNNEYVLKQNTTYLIRITSLANANDISWCAEWYEHTNK